VSASLTPDVMRHDGDRESLRKNKLNFILCICSTLGGEPRWMLSIIQRFGKRCSFHFQGECVAAHTRKLKLYIEIQPQKPKDN
jgi:hypothetical protein